MSRGSRYGIIITGPKLLLGTLIIMLMTLLALIYLTPIPVPTEVVIPLPIPTVTVAEQDPRLNDEFWGEAYRTAVELGLDLDEVHEFPRVTAYNLLVRQTSGNPEISSCGKSVENQVALSRDFFFLDGVKHLCGRTATLIIIEDGEVIEIQNRKINDTMSSRFTNTADILIHPTDESLAYAWGVKQALIYID